MGSVEHHDPAPPHVVVIDSDNAFSNRVRDDLAAAGYRLSWAPDMEAARLLAGGQPTSDVYVIGYIPTWAEDDIAQEFEYSERPAPVMIMKASLPTANGGESVGIEIAARLARTDFSS